MNVVIIDSRDRQSPVNSESHDFEIVLPRAYRANSIELLYANIPLAEYTINDKNNKIPFTSSVDGDAEATIDNGFYDSNTFATAIEDALNAEASTVTYFVSFNSTTGKLSIGVDNGTVQLKFADAKNTAHREMGFSAKDTSAATVLTGDRLMDLSQPRWLVIELSECLSSVDSSDSTLGTFIYPTGMNSGELQTYNRGINFIQLAECHTLRSFRVRLKKHGDQLYDMNGVDWVMALKIN